MVVHAGKSVIKVFSSIFDKIASLVLMVETFFLVSIFSIPFFLNWPYVRKNMQYEPNKNHIAIVLANNYLPERFTVYATVDLPKLIKYFKKRAWSYKVYSRVDKNKLKNIINNPKATIIYLIGHGRRHGIKVSGKVVVDYCEFRDAPEKKFIVQLHCNHWEGKSLAECMSKPPKKSYITRKKMRDAEINKLIDNVVKGKVHSSP